MPVRPGEVRTGVAVEELGDPLAPPMISTAFFCSGRVRARVGVLRGRDDARPVLDEEAPACGPWTELEVRLGSVHFGREVRRLGRDLQVSIGASSASSASYWVPRVGIREEVEVGEVGRVLVAGTARHEHAEEVHRGLLLDERRRRVLPGPAGGSLAWYGQDLRPLLEDRRDLRVGPLLLAGHEVDVEVVPVHAQVQDVERAHRGPAVLVARTRSASRPSFWICLPRVLRSSHVARDGVALLGEDALPIEDRPRIVVDRHPVDLAVVAATDLGEAVGVVALDLGPHVVDRRSTGPWRRRTASGSRRTT